MKKLLAIIAAVAVLPVAVAAADQSAAVQRLDTAATVLNQAKATIPANMLANAQCIAVVPNVKKGAFLVGATYGAGYASCRTPSGWSAPAGISLKAGSIGLQVGGTEANYVILITGQDARQELLNNDLKFSAKASATAGAGAPATDETGNVVVWAQSGGAFAGADISGAQLGQDDSANEALYGRKIPNSQILEGKVKAPAAARSFEAALPKSSR